MQQPLPPFTCSHSPNIPELLWQLECSLIISTYQAGKVIVLSASSPDTLSQLPRNFEHPMGIGVSGEKMAIASKSEVLILSRSQSLAEYYPENPKKYDTLYVPRATYYTGPVDLHDIVWGNEGLWAVNTKFSCLSLINEDYSFTPKWQPNFITELLPEDRCHLNGLVLKDGKPAYVSALGTTDVCGGWRENKAKGGVLMDVESGEIILDKLPMPHSPRIYNDQLYMLLSATGELIAVDKNTGKYDVVNQMTGFVRGMAKHGDYLFVGLSKLRTKSKAFGDLPIAQKSVFAGIVVIYLPMGNIVGHIKYESSVEEIFDVQVLPGIKRPGIVNTAKTTHQQAIVIPDGSFWTQPGELVKE